MLSKMTENLLQDEVVRAKSACWVENVLKECLDLSKYPKIGMAVEEQRGEMLFLVIAYKEISDEGGFEILFETEDEYAARDYYSGLVRQLRSNPSVH